MKSLSELQQSPDVGLPEKRVSVCLSARLVDELAPIDEELFEVQAKIEQLHREERERAEGGGRVRRLGEGSGLPELEARAKDLEEQADAIRERINEASVELRLRAKPAGDWRRWASNHPPRSADDEPHGFNRDKAWAGERVNIDAVADDLALWVVTYNGESASDAWAEFVAANAAPAHLTLAASYVVGLHEQVVDAGKSRSAWRRDRMNALTSD